MHNTQVDVTLSLWQTLSAVLAPVVFGLALGIAFIVVFAIVFTNFNTSDKTVVDFAQKRQSDSIKVDFLMIPKAVEVGAPVDFVVRITGTVTSGCDVPPHASIKDLSSNETVWVTNDIFVLCISDPDAPPRQVNIDWYAGGGHYIEHGIYHNYSNTMMVAQKTGDYELTVDYASVNASKRFTVIEHQQQLAEGLPRYILSEGNKTFEIPYTLSGESARIESIKPDFEHFNLSMVITGVDQNSTMTIVLPKDMLKEIEIRSGNHYCVGNEFVVFVGNENVSVFYEDTSDAEILTFQVKSGTETVYIAGTDLLYEPPRCD